MTKFEIVDAKLHHCGYLTHLLREPHKEACAAIGLNAHRELRARFVGSSRRRAWLVDGHLAAIGGCTGSMLDREVFIWLAAASWACQTHPLAMFREAKRQLEEARASHPVVLTTIMLNDPASFRFAQRLGFVVRRDVETRFEMAVMQYGGAVSEKLAA